MVALGGHAATLIDLDVSVASVEKRNRRRKSWSQNLNFYQETLDKMSKETRKFYSK